MSVIAKSTNIDLSAADAAAFADLQALQNPPQDTPETAQTETQQTAPTEEAPQEQAEAKPDTPKEPEPTPEPSTPEVDYSKRYKDLQKTFTQRSQENATLKQKLHEYETYLQSLRQMQTQAQPEVDPDAIPTVQQVQEIISKTVTEKEKAILGEAEKRIWAAEVARYERTYAEEVDKFAQDLIDSNPLLKAQIDDPDDTSLHESMVKYARNKLFGPQADPEEPRTIDAFKQHMKTYATRKAKTFEGIIKNHEQAAMARAAKAAKPAIVSPGGSIPATTASKPPKWGSPEFSDYMVKAIFEEQQVIDAAKRK